MIMKKIFTFLAAVALSTMVNAQQPVHRCGADHMHKQLEQADPEFRQRAADYDRQIKEIIAARRAEGRDLSDDPIITIPVVFHIIHNYGIENISDEQIFDQMRILNDDFRKLNGDTDNVLDMWKPLVADSRIEFRLAQKDFEGNCTNGIDRIASIETYVGDDGSKLNAWPRDRYLNVWVVGDMEGGVAGYAYYPSGVPNGLVALRDGIIIRHNYIGSIGTSSPGLSRALTHEVGHWINLQHTWGDNNDPTLNCDDDGVEDTPVTAGHDNCFSLFANEHDCDSQPIPNSARFDFTAVTTNTGSQDPTVLNEIDDNTIVFGPAKAVGLSENSLVDGKFAFSNWTTSGMINTEKYYEFQVTSALRQSMTITGLAFNVKRSESGPRKFAIRTSANGFSSNTTATIQPVNAELALEGSDVWTFVNDISTATDLIGCRASFTGPNYVNEHNSTITIRIYAWEAEDTDGTFEVDNVQVLGTFGAIENIQNYMEYSYCSNMFTIGQAERMRIALDLALAGRNNLWSEQNLIFTGLLNNDVAGCAPQADFYPERVVTCVGESVTLIPNNHNGTATSHLWSWEGGTSTSQFPDVTFSTPGWKSITYTATNEFGQTTTTEQAIYVNGDPGYLGGVLTENFSDEQLFNEKFTVRNLDDNTSRFQWSNTTGYNDLGCVFINAYDVDESIIDEGANDIDELIMPGVDLSMYTGTGATFSFRYAFATQAVNLADMTDNLEVYSSRNCGQTWQLRGTIAGINLVSAGNVTDYFVPASVDEWKTETYSLPNTLYEENVMFKFVFKTSEYTNNLYIDNFQVQGTVGVDEANASENSFVMYPNPAGDFAQLEFSVKQAPSVVVNVYDINGKLVMTDNIRNVQPGFNNYRLDLNPLAEGMYNVSLVTDNNVVSKKLMIRK